MQSSSFNKIFNSSSQIKRLQLIGGYFSNNGLGRAASRLPLLEELALSNCAFSKGSLKLVGRRCHRLKSLTLSSSNPNCVYANYIGPQEEMKFNEEAIAIAKFMPELCHLRLSGNQLTNLGLHAILHGCPNLVSFELHNCFNLDFGGNRLNNCGFLIIHPSALNS